MSDVLDHRADFDRDGFVVARGVLDDAAVEVLRDLGRRLAAAGVPQSSQVLYVLSEPPPDRPGLGMLMDQWLNACSHVDHRHAASIIARIDKRVALATGFPVVPFQDVLLSKASAHATFPWHQDLPFWPVDRDDGAVCWVALDEVGPHNGGLEVEPGSHVAQAGPAIDLHTGLPQVGTSGAAPSPGKGRFASLAPGDGVVFHAKCRHRSGRNLSGAPRRAWATSWVHAGARWCFERVPRHPVRHEVRAGEEVAAWSLTRYRRERG